MTLTGETRVPAPCSRVWLLLTDPSSLARALPGCEKLEPQGADSYQLTMKLGVGAISGTYTGTVRLDEKQPESALRLVVESRGSWGFVQGDGRIELHEQGSTTVIRYAGEIQVGGMIAAVGQRLLESAARMVINQFFQNLAQQACS